MSYRSLLILLCILSFAQPGRSEEALQDGARIRVKAGSEVREDGKVVPLENDVWIAGTFVQTDPDFLTIETKKQRKLPINTLQELQVSKGRGRGKAALIGAGIGAAAGVIYGAIDTADCKSEGRWFCGLSYVFTALTIPAGALIGFAVGSEKWSPVPLDGVQSSPTSSPQSSFQLVLQW